MRSQRIITDGDYRRLTSEFNAAVARYRNAAPDVHPEVKAEAARITARDIAIAKQCGCPLSVLLAEKKRELAELEASR